MTKKATILTNVVSPPKKTYKINSSYFLYKSLHFSNIADCFILRSYIGFLYQKMGSALNLIINSSDILAEDTNGNQLYAADNKHCADQCKISRHVDPMGNNLDKCDQDINKADKYKEKSKDTACSQRFIVKGDQAVNTV